MLSEPGGGAAVVEPWPNDDLDDDLAIGAHDRAEQLVRRMPTAVSLHGERVGDDDRPLARALRGLEDHRVRPVAARTVHDLTHRLHREVAALLLVEDPTERARVVEPTEARPVDRAVAAHQRRRMAVTDRARSRQWGDRARRSTHGVRDTCAAPARRRIARWSSSARCRGSAVGALFDLLAATEPVGHDHRVRVEAANGGEQDAFTDSHRDARSARVETERTGHPAAAGVEDLVIDTHPLHDRDLGVHPDHRVVVTVGVHDCSAASAAVGSAGARGTPRGAASAH